LHSHGDYWEIIDWTEIESIWPSRRGDLRSIAVSRTLARYPEAHECPARHLRVKTWPIVNRLLSKLLGARPGPSSDDCVEGI